MEANTSFSLQAKIIRKMQSDEGHVPCYATPNSSQCDNKEQCCWRHDCFDDALDIMLQQEKCVASNPDCHA